MQKIILWSMLLVTTELSLAQTEAVSPQLDIIELVERTVHYGGKKSAYFEKHKIYSDGTRECCVLANGQWQVKETDTPKEDAVPVSVVRFSRVEGVFNDGGQFYVALPLKAIYDYIIEREDVDAQTGNRSTRIIKSMAHPAAYEEVLRLNDDAWEMVRAGWTRSRPPISWGFAPAIQQPTAEMPLPSVHQAIEDNNVEQLIRLLENQADPSERDLAACSALTRVIVKGHWEMIEPLVQRGARIDERDKDIESTFLHLAVYLAQPCTKERLMTCAKLIDLLGVDALSSANKRAETPLNIAETTGNQKLLLFFAGLLIGRGNSDSAELNTIIECINKE